MLREYERIIRDMELFNYFADVLTGVKVLNEEELDRIANQFTSNIGDDEELLPIDAVLLVMYEQRKNALAEEYALKKDRIESYCDNKENDFYFERRWEDLKQTLVLKGIDLTSIIGSISR